MTDPEVVLRRLSSLREHLARLRRRRSDTLEAYQDDVDLQDATAMSLLVAVQDALDIALHIAADEGWGVAASYAESFDLIESHGVIDGETARRLAGMAALRNRLTHGYASVDSSRVWTELPAGIDALDRFASAIAAFLGSEGSAE